MGEIANADKKKTLTTSTDLVEFGFALVPEEPKSSGATVRVRHLALGCWRVVLGWSADSQLAI